MTLHPPIQQNKHVLDDHHPPVAVAGQYCTALYSVRWNWGLIREKMAPAVCTYVYSVPYYFAWKNPQWQFDVSKNNQTHRFNWRPPPPIIYVIYPPLQPFPLQEAREVHGFLVGGKWNPTQIITNYSAKTERQRGDEGITMRTRTSGGTLRDVFLFISKQLVRFFCLIISEMFFFLHILYVYTWAFMCI